LLHRRSALKIALPLLILVGAVLIAGYLQATNPEVAPEAPAERSWLISTISTEIADRQPKLLAYGEIVAQRDVEMRTLVAGQITAVGDNFVNGDLVRAGDLLVQIDSFEFDAAVVERSAQVKEAEARLTEIKAQIDAEVSNLSFDREQLKIAEREWKRWDVLAKERVISEKALDEARMMRNDRARTVSLSEQNLQMLRANKVRQLAVITQTEVGLKRARRDLRNTSLLAPFAGFLTETSAAIGKRLPVNGQVARLIDPNHLEARFHLSDDEFGRLVNLPEGLLGRPARVAWRIGNESFEYAAEIARVSAEIDAASGGVQAYARIDTTGQLAALRPGAFVEVVLLDRLYRQTARLPESALHDNEKVYVIIDGRLVPRLVELLVRIGNDVLVHGELAHGEIVATTRFPGIGPGVKVTAR
jgi:membrane fusion protein, multidrug efflux system